MRRFLLLSLAAGTVLSLTACSPDVIGSWEGICPVNTYGYAADYGMRFDIDDEVKGELSGSGELTDENGYVYPGDLEGTQKGHRVEMALIFPEANGYEIVARVEVKVRGDKMVGDCLIGTNSMVVREEFELELQ